jgi:hypothetical protein
MLMNPCSEMEPGMTLTASALIDLALRNQARVHLWFAARFGTEYPPLRA